MAFPNTCSTYCVKNYLPIKCIDFLFFLWIVERHQPTCSRASNQITKIHSDRNKQHHTDDAPVSQKYLKIVSLSSPPDDAFAVVLTFREKTEIYKKFKARDSCFYLFT